MNKHKNSQNQIKCLEWNVFTLKIYDITDNFSIVNTNTREGRSVCKPSLLDNSQHMTWLKREIQLHHFQIVLMHN